MTTFYAVQLETIRSGSKSQSVYILQVLLNNLGYSCGTADGIWGTRTSNGVITFKKAVGLSATAVCDMTTWDKIFNSRKGAVAK